MVVGIPGGKVGIPGQGNTGGILDKIGRISNIASILDDKNEIEQFTKALESPDEIGGFLMKSESWIWVSKDGNPEDKSVSFPALRSNQYMNYNIKLQFLCC